MNEDREPIFTVWAEVFDNLSETNCERLVATPIGEYGFIIQRQKASLIGAAFSEQGFVPSTLPRDIPEQQIYAANTAECIAILGAFLEEYPVITDPVVSFQNARDGVFHPEHAQRLYDLYVENPMQFLGNLDR